ncbi:hypothetical protein [Mycobacterium colombiense]|nr:hypothetical protein [Mycobacterium colombiense]
MAVNLHHHVAVAAGVCTNGLHPDPHIANHVLAGKRLVICGRQALPQSRYVPFRQQVVPPSARAWALAQSSTLTGSGSIRTHQDNHDLAAPAGAPPSEGQPVLGVDARLGKADAHNNLAGADGDLAEFPLAHPSIGDVALDHADAAGFSEICRRVADVLPIDRHNDVLDVDLTMARGEDADDGFPSADVAADTAAYPDGLDTAVV